MHEKEDMLDVQGDFSAEALDALAELLISATEDVECVDGESAA